MFPLPQARRHPRHPVGATCGRPALVNKNWTQKIKNWTVQRGIYSTVHLTMSLWRREFGQERQVHVTRAPDLPDKAITPPTHCKVAFAA